MYPLAAPRLQWRRVDAPELTESVAERAGLSRIFEAQQDGPRVREIQIVGYGTLLYRASLGHTIGGETAAVREMRPVLVRDFRRLFNLRPDHYESSAKIDARGIENGAMNVEPAPGCTVNGLAFRVAESELDELDRRERYYLRINVDLYDFESGEWLAEGGIYSASPDAPWLERDPDRLLPRWQDIEWARAGAYAVSRRFGEYFDRTTFLADGRTLVADRYREFLAVPETGSPPP